MISGSFQRPLASRWIDLIQSTHMLYMRPMVAHTRAPSPSRTGKGWTGTFVILLRKKRIFYRV